MEIDDMGRRVGSLLGDWIQASMRTKKPNLLPWSIIQASGSSQASVIAGWTWPCGTVHSGCTELFWFPLCAPLILENRSGTSVSGLSLPVWPKILLVSFPHLNGWKIAKRGTLRDKLPFRCFLIQAGSLPKAGLPLNCLGLTESGRSIGFGVVTLIGKSGSFPDLLSFLLCWKRKTICSLLTFLGKGLISPRQY